MPLPNPRPFREDALVESTTSIATTPVVACMIAHRAGVIERVMAGAGATTTGTIAISPEPAAMSRYCPGGTSRIVKVPSAATGPPPACGRARTR